MKKCARDGCPGTATKGSSLCLKHEIQSLLVLAMTPPPAETPQGLHDRIMARVHREQIEESES